MRYCFDLDGTLCEQTENYAAATPFEDRIAIVNKLHDEGNTIIIETARGSMSGQNWEPLTEYQLKEWGVKYDELRAGTKIAADVYVDDKCLSPETFFGMSSG